MKKSLIFLIFKILYLFLILIVVAGASVFATATYLANDINYIKVDGTKISVEQALNELYNKDRFTRKIVAEKVIFSEGKNIKTYNIKDLTDNYSELSTENFAYTCDFYSSIPVPTGMNRTDSLTLDYNKETATLTATATGLYQAGKYYLYFINVNIYLYE